MLWHTTPTFIPAAKKFDSILFSLQTHRQHNGLSNKPVLQPQGLNELNEKKKKPTHYALCDFTRRYFTSCCYCV